MAAEPERSHGLIADARGWCRGRSWVARLPLLVLMAYWTVAHVMDPEYTTLFDAINLGIHELGHVVCSPFGDLVHVLGGTIFQLLAPVLGAWVLLRQRDFFGVAVAGGWLATNFYDVAVYVADARARALPLVGVGTGEPMHDWFYLLGRFGLLRYDAGLASGLRGLGALTFLVATLFGGWLLTRMAMSRRERASRLAA